MRAWWKASHALAGPVLMSMVMVLTVAPPSMADTQGSCSDTDATRARLWENVIGDTSDGNDSLWRCSAEDNLNAVSHTPPGDCKAGIVGSGTWGDCISSFTVWIPSGSRFCLYADYNYGNLKATYYGPLSGTRYDVGAGWNDTLSSIRWRSSPC